MTTPVRTAALFRFDETESVFPPNDAASLVAPLTPAVAGQHPAVVTGAVGYARRFAAGYGFKGVDQVVTSTQLRRSMTAQAILKYSQNGGVQTIVCRGKKTGTTTERRLFCVAIVRTAGVDVLRLEWDRSSGTAATVPDVTFTPPATFFHLAVVRDWVSTTSVLVSVYANGQLVGTTSSVHGDVEDGVAGELAVGCRYNSGGAAYDSFYAGDIDQLKLSNEALSAEEIQHEYRRMFVYPAECYDLVRSCMPPGVAFSQDPTSKLQRVLQVIADGLSIGWSKARELADYYHPDVAWSMMPDWERSLRQPPRPGDRLATRRMRVVGFLQRVHGYSRKKIKTALRELLGIDESQMVSVSTSNMLTEEFDGVTVPEYFEQEPAAGTISIGAGALTLASQLGDDARWDAAHALAVRVVTPIPDEASAVIDCALTPALGELGAMCGMFVESTVAAAALLVGVRRAGGEPGGYQTLFYRTIVNGVSTTTDFGWVTGPVGFRIARVKGTGQFQLYASTNVIPALTVLGLPLPAFEHPAHWAGLFVACDVAPATANNSMAVDSWRLWCKAWRDVFETFLYRDPALVPTEYDRVGAQAVYDKMKPAHQRSTIIEALEFVVGDPHSRVDGEPVGSP